MTTEYISFVSDFFFFFNLERRIRIHLQQFRELHGRVKQKFMIFESELYEIKQSDYLFYFPTMLQSYTLYFYIPC